MRRLAVLAAVVCVSLAVSACTTFAPVVESPEGLRRQLGSGELLEVGECVRVITTDQSVHEFRVLAIDLDEGSIVGEHQRISIENVIALEIRDVSVTRTLMFAGGVGYIVAAIVLLSLGPYVVLGA